MWIICDKRLNCVTVILAQVEDFLHEFRGKLSRYLYTSIKKTFVRWFLVSGGKHITKLWFIVIVPYNLVFLFNVGPGLFLCNVGEICIIFTATSYYQKINRSKIKIA